jgi:hypothetical protein
MQGVVRKLGFPSASYALYTLSMFVFGYRTRLDAEMHARYDMNATYITILLLVSGSDSRIVFLNSLHCGYAPLGERFSESTLGTDGRAKAFGEIRNCTA